MAFISDMFSTWGLPLDPGAFGISPSMSAQDLKKIASSQRIHDVLQRSLSQISVQLAESRAYQKELLAATAKPKPVFMNENDDSDLESDDDEDTSDSDASSTCADSAADSATSRLSSLSSREVVKRLKRVERALLVRTGSDESEVDRMANTDAEVGPESVESLRRQSISKFFSGPQPEYTSPPNSLQSSLTGSKDSLVSQDSCSSIASSTMQSTFTSMYSEASFLFGLGIHQLQTAASGIWGFGLRGVARPSWPAHLHMTLHFLRNQLSYKSHTIARARKALDNVDVNLAPPGCSIVPLNLSISRRELLKFEAEALRFSGGFAYPIPSEIDEKGEPYLYKDYHLEAEWVQTVQIEQKKSIVHHKYLKWFWGREKAADEPVKRRRKVILYLHGGAYVIGNPAIYRHLTGRIASETGCRLFVPNYRLAPEAPFPAAIHDAFAAYLYLINPNHPTFQSSDSPIETHHHHEPYLPEDVILMGDSAGGGLCMALLNYLKDYLKFPNGDLMIRMPGGAILLSPWVDLTFTSQSWRENAEFDWLPAQAMNIHEPIIPATADLPGVAHPLHMYVFGHDNQRTIPLPSMSSGRTRRASLSISPTSPSALSSSAYSVWGGRSWRETLLMSAADRERSRVRDVTERMARHPLVSPVFSEDMRGLPPILIQAGESECLRDETLALAYRYHVANDPRRAMQPSGAAGRPGAGFVRHEMYKDMVHVFMALAWLPQAKLALKNISGFIAEMEEIDESVGVGRADWEEGLVNASTRGYPAKQAKLSKEEGEMVELNMHLRML
ncbi:hypothetical protein HK101_010217 [Irineochytrium annulatum]|nr:hypothetical protein HK101_010217 [Irineochytrium annulatum]